MMGMDTRVLSKAGMQGRYEEAWKHLAMANHLQSVTQPHNGQGEQEMATTLLAAFPDPEESEGLYPALMKVCHPSSCKLWLSSLQAWITHHECVFVMLQSYAGLMSSMSCDQLACIRCGSGVFSGVAGAGWAPN